MDTSIDNPAGQITRSEAVHEIVRAFDLTNKYSEFIGECLGVPNECFFVFSAMSDYDGISFEPLDLYPDVAPATPYYDDINTATILGLVHGYVDETSTPFHPQNQITRIQALKVVMGASLKVLWREKFEIADTSESAENITLPFNDVNAQNPLTWWYPRYLKAALDVGVIEAADCFRPDEQVTRSELEEMLNKALK
jgi:hypothetical protein